MNLQQLNPWNWFKDEENSGSATVPVKRNSANNSELTAPASNHPFVQLQRSIDQLFDGAFQSFGFPSRARSNNGLGLISVQRLISPVMKKIITLASRYQA